MCLDQLLNSVLVGFKMFLTVALVYLGFPGGSEVKASAWNAGDPGLIPQSVRSSGKGNGKPTPVLLPGESHGGRSLVGYSSWGHKELDTTERLHFHFHFGLFIFIMAFRSSYGWTITHVSQLFRGSFCYNKRDFFFLLFLSIWV